MKFICHEGPSKAECPCNKKNANRAPAATAAQNVLMRKLGLATSQHVETEDFASYISLFQDGLSEEQARIIDELFVDKGVALVDGVMLDAV
jgi:hypothetical protein